MSAQLSSPTEELLSFGPSMHAVLAYFWAYAAVAWSAPVVLEEAVATTVNAIRPPGQRRAASSFLGSWVWLPYKRMPLSVWFGGVVAEPDIWCKILGGGIVTHQYPSGLACRMGAATMLSLFDRRSFFRGRRRITAVPIDQQFPANWTSCESCVEQAADGLDH